MEKGQFVSARALSYQVAQLFSSILRSVMHRDLFCSSDLCEDPVSQLCSCSESFAKQSGPVRDAHEKRRFGSLHKWCVSNVRARFDFWIKPGDLWENKAAV